MENQLNREKSFTLFKILYTHIVLVIIITIIGGVIGTTLGFLKDKPIYTARTSMIMKASIYSSSNPTPAVDVNTTGNYFDTITEIIDAPDTIQRARSISGDREISRSKVSVTNNEDSLVFNISYKATSVEKAKSRLSDLITATKQLIAEKDLPVKDIKLIDLQNDYYITSTTGLAKYIVVGVLLGGIAGILTAILMYITDNKIHSSEELEELTNSSVIAYITKEIPEED